MRTSVLACLGMALVAGPYFRGLYFPGEQLVATLAFVGLGTAYAFWLLGRGERPQFGHPLTYALWGLTLVYALALAVAADRRLALQEALKMFGLAVAYGLVQDAARSMRAVRGLAYAVAWAGMYVAVLGVAAVAGQFKYPDAIVGDRIASVFQYPNTLAAYLGACVVLALSLWQGATTRAGRWLAAAPAYLCLFVLVFTYSRGGWLVFALVAAIVPLVQPAGLRLSAFLRLSLLLAVLAPAALLFARAGGDPTRTWAAFLAGVPLVLAADELVLLLLRLPRALRVAVAAVPPGLVVTTLAALLLRPQLLPAALVTRVEAIRLDEYSAWSRIQWSRDALRMIADRPVLGAGGGAWQALYQGYQSWSYYSTQAHNHFFQLWLETGTVGFLIWLGLWAAFLATCIRVHRQTGAPGERALVGGVALAAITIGLHSLIDFNLAMLSVSLTLWTLFGMARAMERVQVGDFTPASQPRRRRRESPALVPRIAVLAVGLLVAAGIGSLWLGYWYGQKGARAMNEGRREEAARHFEQALRFDPFTASFYFDRATLLQRLQPGDPAAMERAGRLMERGLRLSPYDANLHAMYGGFLLQRGEFEHGMAEIERAAELHPFAAARWENVAVGHTLVGRVLLSQGQREAARLHLQRAVAAADRLAAIAARVPPQVPDFQRTPAATPLLDLAVGQAQAMLGDLEPAGVRLTRAAQAPEPGVRAEALLWLAALADHRGDAAAAGRLRREAAAIDQSYADDYEPVRVLVAAAR